MLYSLGFGRPHLLSGHVLAEYLLNIKQLGMVNFFFCLPAMRTIDTLGRRSWLLATLPLMCLMLIAAAGAYPGDEAGQNIMELARTKVAIVFIFCAYQAITCTFRAQKLTRDICPISLVFAAVYSPGLGAPISCSIRNYAALLICRL